MTAFILLSRVLAKSEEDRIFFECPGCQMVHGISHGAGPGPRWGWNGDVDIPGIQSKEMPGFICPEYFALPL